ncbi:MAG: glycerol-3-phosphate dehydrogenase [Acidobacteria bacterium]|nr:glycerol-3-phosphate dehydrogenase [Acidobacteriota bacterium]
MTEFSWNTRLKSLNKLANTEFDVLVIGGGITGSGIALDAADRRLSVALVEKRDFASGTSSRSTKLIHGGLRYLEHFDFSLVREALQERTILSRIAPHLVEAFPFAIPIYRELQQNYDHPLKMRAGLLLYDLLAGRHRMNRHRRISAEEALKLAPQLDPEGLKGALLYYDALTDDSRLVIEVIKAARSRGATVSNYTRLLGFTKGVDGRISGARLRDELTGESFVARSKVLINATGVWVEDIIKLDEGGEAHLSKRIRPSKGIHLTVSADRLRVTSAWLIPSLDSHRFYFVVPWKGRVNIGTTDTDYSGNKDTPHSERHEVEEILAAINQYFPGAQLEPADVISSWAGLRPLITDPRAVKTSEVSRKEELYATADGLISISGGKLTTYRRMARSAIDLAATRLSKIYGIKSDKSRTEDLTISGGAMKREELERTVQLLTETEILSLQAAEHLVFTYGSNYRHLLALLHEDEKLRKPLVEGLPDLSVEIVYAARQEMALTLSDALIRRTRLAVLAGEGSVECAPGAAALMARELGWDYEEMRRQIDNFILEYKQEYESPYKHAQTIIT